MLKKIFKYTFLLVCLLLIGLFLYIQNNKPVYNGILELKDLNSKVTIYFDAIGVPHIYAQNQHDAYLALGYVHAQDRLWQMELIRRIASGRLSEIFGEELLETDQLFRGIGIERAAKGNMQKIDTTNQSYQLTKAYLNGINQFIESGSTPVEFRLLGIDKEKYSLIDIYNVYGFMAFGFAQAHKTDPFLTKLKEQLAPVYLMDLDIDIDPKSTLIKNYPKQNKSVASSIVASVNRALDQSPVPPFIGSNSWVIGADKTKNGKVILANDPHIEFSQPAVWYQSHLITPDYEFYGFNLALTPFPLQGHNRDFAFGVTMFENDDLDFYKESENQKFKLIKELIHVKGEDDVEIEIREGPHGPIINDFLENIDSQEMIAMDWVYTKHNADLIDITYQISHATSLAEFKKGVSQLHAPGLNMMYGDAKENIAWFATGKLYKRENKAHSKFILNGANGQDDQLTYLDFSQNPKAINPPWDYVYSANNQPEAVAGIMYPGYYLPEDRAKRIVDLLKPKNDFTKEDVATMIMDVESPVVQELLPIITKEISKVNLNAIEKEAIKYLMDWDGEFRMELVAPTIYTKFIYHFLYETFADEMGEGGFEQFIGMELYKIQIANQIKNYKSIWWDNVQTKEVKELRDEIFTTAFHKSIAELEEQFGSKIDDWKWENALSVTHKHAFDKVAILRNFFNVGPFKTHGGNEVINNQLFDINGTGKYEVKAGPSTRRIIDFSDIENSMAILPTGQSGNVFSKHYKNQSQQFLKGEFVKMMINKEEIAKSKDKLQLEPID